MCDKKINRPSLCVVSPSTELKVLQAAFIPLSSKLQMQPEYLVYCRRILFDPSSLPFSPFLQLVLEAQNVPELSAGVNCTFEDLTEMNGLVEGNRIKCSSPAEKEMPRIIVDKGNRERAAAFFFFFFYPKEHLIF